MTFEKQGKMEYYIGIDPGSKGSLAAVSSMGTVALMPLSALTEEEIWAWIMYHGKARFACIEKVGGYIRGSKGLGHTMFNFGRGTGVLIGCLIASGIPFEEVTPQKWQKFHGLKRNGEDKKKWKPRLKAFAKKLYPHEDVILETADALLIADYCRRTKNAKA